MSESRPPHERRAVLSADHAPPHDLPIVTFAANGCAMAHWRGVSIVVWATQATAQHVHELQKLTETIGQSRTCGSNVVLVVNRAPLPTYEARRAIHELTRRYEQNITCSATLIEGTGFWSSAIRSLVTSLHLVGRWSFELKTFSDIGTLSEWVAPIHTRATGTEVSAEELAGALAWVLRQPAIKETRATRAVLG